MMLGKGTLSLEKEYNVLIAICTSLHADLSHTSGIPSLARAMVCRALTRPAMSKQPAIVDQQKHFSFAISVL